jgi:hypothetical protein
MTVAHCQSTDLCDCFTAGQIVHGDDGLRPEAFAVGRTEHAPDTATPGERPRRFDQCDDTCTTDCGHCKGKGLAASSADDKAGECTACGHEHSPNLGGICVGCPCEEGGWR